ncbi:MAG: glycosyltransferase family 4 protein [bacterium]
MKKTKIIFISRAYPPTVGGIENQNYELGKWLGEIADVTIIANTGGKKFLPLFLPYATIKALFLMSKNDAVLLGDGVLGITAWTIKLFSKKSITCVVHGLDLTFKNNLYQKLWVGFFLKKIDKFVAVGNETVAVAIEKGLAKEKIVFIPNGVDTEKHLLATSKDELAKILNTNIDNKKILLTSGRLAKRKGVAWFVENVLPKLSQDFLYVVAGDGPDKENILSVIEKSNTKNNVLMLGYVSDNARNILLNSADLFVQPNIKVAGDMEGFGISVIEAGACRLPVIASDIEGLKDAIKDSKNGFLVESANADMFTQKINELFANGNPREIYGQAVRDFVIANYQWEKIAQQYLAEITKL